MLGSSDVSAFVVLARSRTDLHRLTFAMHHLLARPHRYHGVTVVPTEHDTLDRFLEAQAPVYGRVLQELHHGLNAGHWTWFIFPQLRALGNSLPSQFYGIDCEEEAGRYLRHEVLGARLTECVGLLLAIPDKSVRDVMGTPDDLKLRSCLTLFNQVAPEDPFFSLALERLFEGRADAGTLALLNGGP